MAFRLLLSLFLAFAALGARLPASAIPKRGPGGGEDTPPVPSLVLPARLAEGDWYQAGQITLDRAAPSALSFTFSAGPADELNLPTSVVIPAGAIQVSFSIQARDDYRIDGDQLVTVTATAPGLAPATAQTLTIDRQTRALQLSLPTTVLESSTTYGSVYIPGYLTEPLVVSLAANGEALTVSPATVTIPAGQTSASFTLSAPDNDRSDGSRPVLITATAPAFVSASATTVVRDNEVAGYRFDYLTDVLLVDAPVSLRISAADVEGNVIPGVSATVSLSVLMPDGTTLPVSPASVTLSGSAGWSGQVTLPTLPPGALDALPLRLRAMDSTGRKAEFDFDVMRQISQPVDDLVWDATRAQFYASVPLAAGGNYARKVVRLDPVTLQVTASLDLPADPGRLALTSGGEALYVAMDSTGTIAKIDLATFTVAYSFAVGTDPYRGMLWSEDLATVAGQPDVLVVSRQGLYGPRHAGVVAYEGGVPRPAVAQSYWGANRIEASADPTLFFGHCNETSTGGFRLLKVDSSGVRETAVNTQLLSGESYTDIQASGNLLVSSGGMMIDGLVMRRLGRLGLLGFSTTGDAVTPAIQPDSFDPVLALPSAIRPDAATGRVYAAEHQSPSSGPPDFLTSYDPYRHAVIRRLSMPGVGVAHLIRWGTNGLAFRTPHEMYYPGTVRLVSSRRLVPILPAADLRVQAAAGPLPAAVGTPVRYTVSVENAGTQPAPSTVLTVVLPEDHGITGVTADRGTATVSGQTVVLPAGLLLPGTRATLVITAVPQAGGRFVCDAAALSDAPDVNFADNSVAAVVDVGFAMPADGVRRLRFNANNLVWDSTRRVFWATVSDDEPLPFSRSVVAVDPTSGRLFNPIPINAVAGMDAIALSANGRFLYVGLRGTAEVLRLNLDANPVEMLRIPLMPIYPGAANIQAYDLEVLDGDGTSVLVTESSERSATVYDGSIPRPGRLYGVCRQIARTGTPGTYINYGDDSSNFSVSRLAVDASGVRWVGEFHNLFGGFFTKIRGGTGALLGSDGTLVDDVTFALRARLGFTGEPCVDGAAGRVYLSDGVSLRAFESATGAAAGSLALPAVAAASGYYGSALARWGLDGFALLSSRQIRIGRWSSLLPRGADTNRNGIADEWETEHFGPFGVTSGGDSDGDGVPDALEYLLASSPVQAGSNPMRARVERDGQGRAILHVVFPRRVGLPAGVYGYEGSDDLLDWFPVTGVIETVTGSQNIDGVPTETVDAAMPATVGAHGFVRLKWLRP